jgi:hypothetical protein
MFVFLSCASLNQFLFQSLLFWRQGSLMEEEEAEVSAKGFVYYLATFVVGTSSTSNNRKNWHIVWEQGFCFVLATFVAGAPGTSTK